jgi:hypothetical protein
LPVESDPVDSRGIPHLAKNERDVGHPSLVSELGVFLLGLSEDG